jgi:hypothetical protein
LANNESGSKKVIEFYHFDGNGNILEKTDQFSIKLEDIDHNEKLNRSVFFK